MNSSSIEQGTIVIADILFSNQVGIKPRPALIISNSRYNKKYRDIVAVKVTSSKENPFPYNVDISQKNLVFGELAKESTIMTDFPITLDKSQIRQVIAKLSEEKLKEGKKKIRELYAL